MCPVPTVLDLDDVGVPELRGEPSVRLRRIAGGETFRMTDHGHIDHGPPVPQLTEAGRQAGPPVASPGSVAA